MEFRYEHADTLYTVQLEPQPDGSYLATVGDRTYTVTLQRAQSGQFNLLLDGKRLHAYVANQKSQQTATTYHYVALVDRTARHYEFTTARPTASRRGGSSAQAGSLRSQMPGQVMQIFVQEGQLVEKGQNLLTLEAMKMEIRVTAPADGTITRIHVQQGETVERGQQLIEID